MNSTNSNSLTSDTLLAPVQEDGKLITAPRSRIKNAKAAHESYMRMKTADENASYTRAKVQAMLDGEAPYDQAAQRMNGLAEMCNVNWGQGEQLLALATSPYIDLVESVDHLCTMPTNFGDPTARLDWEQTMAEEFSRMVRGWPEFFPRYQFLIHQFLAHGVGVAFREDEIDWRWQIAPLGDFLIPRQTRASDEEIEIGAVVRGMPPHELFSKIEDEEAAKELGWNVLAVKKALMNATQADKYNASWSEWETLQREFKNNDLGVSGAAYTSEVKLVFMWVKELDGTVSQYVFPEKLNDDGDEFLYVNRSRYSKSSEVFNTFCYGVGTNGYFHSIRGLGHKIFSIVQALNRLRCRFFDSLMTSSMLMLEPESEQAMEDLSLIHFGPFVIKPPNVKFIQKDYPNFGNSLIPGLNELNSLLQQQSGQYSTEAIFNQAKERTQYEVQAQLESLSNISISALSLFYQPWERLMKETVRRVARPDYFPQDPGGEQVAEFRERCMARGVPEEALMSIDPSRVRVVRAIGNGSSAARSAIMRQVYELSANFDPQGRQQAIRDLTRTIGGVEAADRYAPAPENQRPPMETKTAELENILLMQGNEIQVLPSEMHPIHFPVHLDALEQLIASIDSGEQPLEEAAPKLFPLHTHASAHAEFMVGEPDYPQIKKRLQQIDEVAWNLAKRLEKLRRDAALAQEEAAADPNNPEAPAAQGQTNAANPNALPDTLQRQMVEASTKLRIAEETHSQQLRHREEAFRQSQALKDAEVAASIARKQYT